MKNDSTNFWNNTAVSPTYGTSRITNYSIGDTVTGFLDNDNGSNQSFSMEMTKDGMDYYIRTLEINGSPDIRKLD